MHKGIVHSDNLVQ